MGKNTGALISGGAQLLGAGVNAIASGGQNRKSREWSEKMYQTQRQDNIEFWNMQNAYNSPEQQMNRLMDAKLNPNLIYGQSSGGAAGQASPIQKVDAKRPEFRTPDFSGIANSVTSFYDTRIKQAQADNLKEQNKVIQQQALLNAAQVASTGVITDKNKVELENLKNYSADAARLSNLQKEAQIFSTNTDTDRKQALHGVAMEQAFQNALQTKVRSALLRQQIKNSIIEGNLKALELNLNKAGIQKNDPLYMRAIMQNKEFIKKLYNNDY